MKSGNQEDQDGVGRRQAGRLLNVARDGNRGLKIGAHVGPRHGVDDLLDRGKVGCPVRVTEPAAVPAVPTKGAGTGVAGMAAMAIVRAVAVTPSTIP
jgi:hypothetical protein